MFGSFQMPYRYMNILNDLQQGLHGATSPCSAEANSRQRSSVILQYVRGAREDHMHGNPSRQKLAAAFPIGRIPGELAISRARSAPNWTIRPCLAQSSCLGESIPSCGVHILYNFTVFLPRLCGFSSRQGRVLTSGRRCKSRRRFLASCRPAGSAKPMRTHRKILRRPR